MSGERAKRFPLALEDLKRAPRKAEGRAGERHAAGDGTRQRLSAGASARGGTVATPAPKPAAAPKPIAPKLATPVAATRKPAAPKPPAPGPAAGKPAAPPAAPKAASRPAMQMQNAALAGAHALTSERVRERMVERLRANGVADARVLEAMAAVPRHLFVDPGLATQAYEDSALPIGHQQTISKPSVVARMIELAMAGRTLERVLEIGTGCGYQAAVLSHVARDVYSIERIKPLYERAKLNLRPLRVPNIRLHYGDGRVGLPSAAPFDAIVIAAAGLDVPQALLEQLAIGGRLVAPVGGQSGQPQVLTLVERVAPAQWRESRLDRVFFVPLKSGVI
ncbi:protein-L-isoaspartate(D-aspartate) O-methyltransferase [Burkholderia ubonensis]|uniref:protein-L-isoaspartate(D-aspartate) O-methyltransferase n=1 Tax=Burkholderia ubonensis TaxID=101571 RepID=UPI00075ED50C|nr:protein-L-isoaspartate(D-aspartate) O-methyltransferase [Burkholderia ubonensis]KVC85762.1 protein-L-isoaspartate O-methyltransferase [Burkholderia ubonensis]KVC96149.1 protein-L-isoaspartate O-methyltransferase [Burkholderia ubonensis]KVD08932.1 protein-L-isoaspartate O-methyltransferase [Burkholderia ubonensis]KVD27493.1 protein-L-isoaspartate O-methyltransferase [Burkholderia ubonensis]KVN34098.1 protein-L-isoaspartate O-methyltransferase [Burkholderia ubonensis]